MGNRLYTFHVSCDDPEFLAQVEKWMMVAGKWDEPELDRRFLGAIGYESLYLIAVAMLANDQQL